jgi:hypothetical protein
MVASAKITPPSGATLIGLQNVTEIYTLIPGSKITKDIYVFNQATLLIRGNGTKGIPDHLLY